MTKIDYTVKKTIGEVTIERKFEHTSDEMIYTDQVITFMAEVDQMAREPYNQDTSAKAAKKIGL